MYGKRILEMGLPDLMLSTRSNWPGRRQEIMGLMEQELYGILPDLRFSQHSLLNQEDRERVHGGNSIFRDMVLVLETHGKTYTVPYWYVLPRSEQPVPLWIMPCFSRTHPVSAVPAEEICSRGYGLCCFDYQQVTTDDADFTSGLAAAFYPDGQRGEHDGGKIAIWAWFASRLLDEMQKVPEVASGKICIVGHSRLGKTALWAAARDTRFAGAASIQSGCAGAALARGNTGETVADITRTFPFWFAPAYRNYAGQEAHMPFDQHFLLALLAPRPLCVTSAASDLWADPENEYLACLAASPVYTLLGEKAIRDLPELTDDMVLPEGRIGYCRRPGTHCFTRTDWHRILDLMDANL